MQRRAIFAESTDLDKRAFEAAEIACADWFKAIDDFLCSITERDEGVAFDHLIFALLLLYCNIGVRKRRGLPEAEILY